MPDDIVFYTQITMEAAEDPEFLDAMKRAHIQGALVGVESVTEEGLEGRLTRLQPAGDELVARLRAFRRHGIHVLGSFIFGLPSDRKQTFDATVALAEQADLDLRAVRPADAVPRARSISRSGRPTNRSAARRSTAFRSRSTG